MSRNSIAATLYTLDTSGRLLTVDQTTGTTTAVIENLDFGSWTGLSSAPNDNNALYALHNTRPPTLDDPTFSRLTRIDLTTGMTTLLPFYESEALGVENVFASGLAISPENPDLAWVVGYDLEIPPTPYIWSVDAISGAVVQPAAPLNNVRRVETITFGLDATTLYGTNQAGELITIDRENQEATVVGSPGLTDFLTGLAFHPEDGRLFAVNGFREDALVILDATTGAFVEEIGGMRIPGPEGLAFVPDPVILPNDCDFNGTVDLLDLDCANAADITSDLLNELGLLAGDLNGNGEVNLIDFLALREHFATDADKYTQGDINDTGNVDLLDFLIMATNFGKSAEVELSAVPEPTSRLLLLLAVVALSFRMLPNVKIA